jgi:hypothetical protein
MLVAHESVLGYLQAAPCMHLSLEHDSSHRAVQALLCPVLQVYSTPSDPHPAYTLLPAPAHLLVVLPPSAAAVLLLTPPNSWHSSPALTLSMSITRGATLATSLL